MTRSKTPDRSQTPASLAAPAQRGPTPSTKVAPPQDSAIETPKGQVAAKGSFAATKSPAGTGLASQAQTCQGKGRQGARLASALAGGPVSVPQEECRPLAALLLVLPTLGAALPESPGEMLVLLGQPDNPLDLLGHLLHKPLDRFWQINTTSTTLCQVLHAFAGRSRTRRINRKQVAGGKKHPQRFTLADVDQPLLLPPPLPTGSGPLCRKLAEEVLLLLRLVSATQRFVEQRSHVWMSCYVALAEALERVLELTQALYEQTNWWIAQRCLRWALREGWVAMFGPGAPIPKALRPWLAPLPLTLVGERELLVLLTKEEQEAQARADEQAKRRGRTAKKVKLEVPAPFAEVVAAWQTGNFPAALLSDGPLTEEQEQQARFWV